MIGKHFESVQEQIDITSERIVNEIEINKREFEIPNEVSCDDNLRIPKELEVEYEKTTKLTDSVLQRFNKAIQHYIDLRNVHYVDNLKYVLKTLEGYYKGYEDIKEIIYDEEFCDQELEDVFSFIQRGTYDNTISLLETYFEASKTELNNIKPKNAPEVERWFGEGGKIEIRDSDDENVIWRYIDKDGKYADYKLDRIMFPQEAKHPVIQPISIGGFTGNRALDKQLYLKESGLDKIPDGYDLHHGYEDGQMELILDEYHHRFTHSGGHSYERQDLY